MKRRSYRHVLPRRAATHRKYRRGAVRQQENSGLGSGSISGYHTN
jgi:hypothetical protein